MKSYIVEYYDNASGRTVKVPIMANNSSEARWSFASMYPGKLVGNIQEAR